MIIFGFLRGGGGGIPVYPLLYEAAYMYVYSVGAESSYRIVGSNVLSGPGATHIWLYKWFKSWPYICYQGNSREELANSLTFDPPTRLSLKGLLCYIAEVWEHYR